MQKTDIKNKSGEDIIRRILEYFYLQKHTYTVSIKELYSFIGEPIPITRYALKNCCMDGDAYLWYYNEWETWNEGNGGLKNEKD